MRRRKINRKLETYTLYTNQGTPDVYVAGVYVGTVSGGILKWIAREYESAQEITLENITIPSDYTQTFVNAVAWNRNGILASLNNQYWATGYKETVTYTCITGDYLYKNTYTGVNSGTLMANMKGVTINAKAEGSGNFISYNPVRIRDAGEQSTAGSWDGSYILSGSSVTVAYGTWGSWRFYGENPNNPNLAGYGLLDVSASR